MKKHWRYLKYVVRHKWFVFLACRVVGAPIWRAVIHDWSKFSPAEWSPYVEMFYGDKSGDIFDPKVQAAFDAAWLHHQHHNPHHWQHWLLREDDGDLKALAMPLPLVREMVADWMGAGKAITGSWDLRQWYAKASEKMVLHPVTERQVGILLDTAVRRYIEMCDRRRVEV